jgi:hypothetical protein
MSRYPVHNVNWRDGTTVWEWNERSREWLALAELHNHHNQRKPWQNPPLVSGLSGDGLPGPFLPTK